MARSAEFDVGAAKQHGRIEPVRHSSQCRKLPVADMAREDQCWLVVEAKLGEQFVGALLDFDAAVLGMRRVVLPDVIDVRELRCYASEIVPDAVENGIDFLRRFLGKRGGEIGVADLVLAKQRSDPPRDLAEQVCGLDRIEITRRAQQADREATDSRLAERLERIANPGLGAEQETLHRVTLRSGVMLRPARR